MAGFEVIIYGRFWVIAEAMLVDGLRLIVLHPGHGCAFRLGT